MRAKSGAEPEKIAADTSEQANGRTRGASFGIVVAVIAATLMWAGLLGLGLSLLKLWW